MAIQQSRRHALPAPSPIFYYAILPLLRLYLFIKYNYRKPKSLPPIPKDAPFVVLGSHASNLDFLFTFVALYPHRMNALVSSYFFDNKALGLLLTSLRCIPRKQFSADPASIRAMLGVIKRNGSVLLYPEGEVNGTGRFYSMPPGIGRMCKLMGASVYAAVNSGSYMTRPKWGCCERKGRVECKVTLVADAAAVRELSARDLDARIQKALYYDDHAWQKQARVPFKRGDRATGLENMLYKCPRCGAEGKMRARGDTLSCAACQNGARMDVYGLLHPVKKGDIIFDNVADWVQFERDALKAETALPDFRMQHKASILLRTGADREGYVPAGGGVMGIDRDFITYEGVRQGKRVSLRFALKDFYKTPFKSGAHMEIPGEDDPKIALVPDNPQLLEKYVLAVEALYALREQQEATKA
ncbi:MAG: lysophospholipid acyltransferase family protein [Clostridia bacterium]|nr:lysophospholipid acyltransferase family protein [Clostridia bacterium]